MNATFEVIQWFTDFGDQAIVLPTSVFVLLFLLLSRCWKTALAWAISMGGVLALMLLLKLGIGACGPALGAGALDSPSGHTASATMLYGGIAAILFPRLGSRVRFMLAISVALLFGASRVILHDHSVIEVVIGGLVGLGGLAIFMRLRGPGPSRLPRVWIMLVLAGITLLEHGHRMTIEHRIHSFATLRLRALICPSQPHIGL
ncbi:phosphatase PAP2 family protein [Lichenicola cladoniae]|uniref:Phosphatase PAP2 family protein n=1 Tax=Lichenicola cladoniae TaxID=1484109 RepID=A0A6M8HRG7_9PROT|nr:phosphatase PAP2 family protein [Lichenicola cladoniae]NPD69117.1 phosphatase PAP2 family protein [Acetobacteraceae bacterium]QKE90938.1 phosphatase PAP2 family protein [Lichenicola cladoniae]